MSLDEKIEYFCFCKHHFYKSLIVNFIIMITMLYVIYCLNISILGYLVINTVQLFYLFKYYYYVPYLRKIIIEKFIALFICVYIAALFMKVNILIVISGFILLVLITMYFKFSAKKWWMFALFYLFSIMINAFILLFAMFPLIEEQVISEKTFGIVIIVVTIVAIILVVFTEKRKHILREIKVGTYFSIAVIATITASLFFIEEKSATNFSEFVAEDLKIALESINDVPDEYKIMIIKKMINDYEELNGKMFNSDFINIIDDPNILMYLFTENAANHAKDIISLLFSIILFPYLVMGVWCTFLIEFREKKIDEEDLEKTQK